jgi:tRNA(His) guanylyltransferase
MAKSKYEYVKAFETDDRLLPNCWIVIRLDGRGFTRFTGAHGFTKPNDQKGLELMNRCAMALCQEFDDVMCAFGESDEYSFVLRPRSTLFGRRSSKLSTVFASTFTANYVYHWNDYFSDRKLLKPPVFDGRAVLYPSDQNMRDYLSWRQADTHINNLYNTCYWNLVQRGGMTEEEATKTLQVRSRR